MEERKRSASLLAYRGSSGWEGRDERCGRVWYGSGDAIIEHIVTL